MSSPQDRAAVAAQLRTETYDLLSRSGLFGRLDTAFGGEAMVTGSASYDLMVWRDIDIHLAIEQERWRDWMAFGATLAKLFAELGMPLHGANYLNDWVDPHPLGAGLYWGLAFKDRKGDRWNIDLWGWDPFDYAVRQARDFSLRTDLAACDRDLILRLKTEARAQPGYHGVTLTSFDIYQCCIAGGGDSLDAVAAWKAAQD